MQDLKFYFHKRIIVAFLGFATLFLFAFAARAHAAADTWIASSSGNWSTASNWSLGAAPTASDTALFSASSTANALIDTGITVGGIDIASGYTGTITQGSGNAITIGTSTSSYGFSQSTGTFQGSSGNDAITVNGPFSLTGGTFASTAGTLIFQTNAAFSGGTFQNGGGTAIFDPTSSIPIVTGSATFNNLQIGNNSSISAITIATGTTLTAQGYLYILQPWTSFGLLGGGQVNVQGNIEASYAARYATGTVAVVLTGSGNQIVGDDAVGGRGSADSVMLPDLTIAKSAGTVSLSGTIVISNNFANTNTTPLDPGTSTVVFGPAGNFDAGALSNTVVNSSISGSSTFYNLVFGADGNIVGSSSTYTIATGTILTAQGYFYPGASDSALKLLGGGQINVQGNIEDGYVPGMATGTAGIVLNGTGTQLVGDDSLLGNGYSVDSLSLPNLTIDKTSGSVSLAGKIQFMGDFTNSNGTPMDPGTSTVFFFGPALTITGTSTFNDLSLGYGVSAPYSGGPGSGISTNDITIATGTTVTAQGFLWLNTNYTSVNLLGGGTIDVWGDLEGGHYGQTSGTATIVLNGTSTQLIDDNTSVGGPSTAYLPNLVIDKPSGIAYATSTPIVTGALNVLRGELQLLPASATDPSTFTVSGPVTVAASGTLSDYAPSSASSTLVLGSSLVNDGTISFSGGGPVCGNPAGILLQSATSGVPISWSGTGFFGLQNLSMADQTPTLALTAYNSTNAGDVGPSIAFAPCGAPAISSFSASPSVVASLGTSTLSWSAGGTSWGRGPASSVAIDPVSFATTTLAGSFVVSPSTTTLYTLSALSSYGTATATTSVTVLPTSTTILATSTTLTATTTSIYVTASSTATSSISVPSAVAAPTLDLSALTSSSTATLPGPITVAGPSVTVSLPANLAITAATTSWDGIMNLPHPTVSYTAPTPSAGHTVSVSSAIELGLPAVPVSLSLPVEIVFPGAAGSAAGWSRNGVFTPITASCTSLTNPVLGADGDCTGTSGNDLIIWTRHFTTFLVWTESALAASAPTQVGGGGSAYDLMIGTGSPVTATTSVTLSLYGTMAYTMQVSADPSFANTSWVPYQTSFPYTLMATISPQTIYARFRAISGTIVGTASATVSYVPSLSSSLAGMGAAGMTVPQMESLLASLESQLAALEVKAGIVSSSSYSFSRNLTLGMKGSDVKALQKYLIAHATGPAAQSLARVGVTGYFGFLTKDALAAFQAAHGIPATGFFGPVTRTWAEKHP